MTDAAHVESPCIKVCTLDAAGQFCSGCFRSLDEIGLWTQLSNAERARVLERLPQRRRQYETAHGSATISPDWTAQSCEKCGVEFACGAQDAKNPCWCVSYPPVAPSSARATCLCPACLAAAALT